MGGMGGIGDMADASRLSPIDRISRSLSWCRIALLHAVLTGRFEGVRRVRSGQAGRLGVGGPPIRRTCTGRRAGPTPRNRGERREEVFAQHLFVTLTGEAFDDGAENGVAG